MPKMIPAVDADGKPILNADGTPKMVEVPDETPNDPPEPKLVSRDAYDRVSKDMHDYKKKNADLQKQIDDMKVQGHKAKEDYKALAEHHEQRASQFESELTGLKSGLISSKKTEALTTEAVKHGINPASIPDLELLDFDELTVETTSNGKILVSGADRAVARLKTLRPHWFTKVVPSVNPLSPDTRGPVSGTVTIADLNKAEDQWKKTKSDADKKAYFDLIQRFKSQGG
jgi:hypothetical protein